MSAKDIESDRQRKGVLLSSDSGTLFFQIFAQ